MDRLLRDKGFFHLVSGNTASQALALVAGLLLARILRPDELGETRIVQSYLAVLIVVATAGMNSLVFRYCAGEFAEGEAEGLFAGALRRTLWASGATMLAFLVLVQLVGLASSPEMGLALTVASLAIPFAAVFELASRFYQARQRTKVAAWLTFAYRLAALALSVLGAAGFGFWGWVAAFVGAWAVGAGLALWKLGFSPFSRPISLPTGAAGFAGFALTGNIVYILGQYGDFFVIDHFVEDRTRIGGYALASLFLVAANQFNGAAQSILGPRFSAARDNVAELRVSALKAQAGYWLAALGLAAVIGAGAWFLIPIVFPGFPLAPYVTLLLMLRFAISAAGCIVHMAVFALGEVRLNVIATTIGITVGLLASWRLTLEHGILGAAWGQVIGATVVLSLEWASFFVALRWAEGPKRERVRLVAEPLPQGE